MRSVKNNLMSTDIVTSTLLMTEKSMKQDNVVDPWGS